MNYSQIFRELYIIIYSHQSEISNKKNKNKHKAILKA